MSIRDRGWRRYQRQRMIARALKTEIVKYWWYDDQLTTKNQERQEFLKDIASRHCDRLSLCSCSACGNQRHNDWLKNWDMLTMQERRAYNSFLDQMKEIE